MADIRGFRDAFVHGVEKRKTAPILSGYVLEPAQTWDKTVTVRIGTEDVVAAYRLAVPQVGDAVEVQRTGAGYKIVSHVPQPFFPDAGGGLIPPLQGTAGGFGRLTAWGHSWVDTTHGNTGGSASSGVNAAKTRLRDSRFPDRIAGMLGASWPDFRNRGHSSDLFLGVNVALNLPGYTAIQSLIRPDNATRAPYVATHGHHLIVTGLNDVALQGPFTTAVLKMWKNAWRATIARLWAGGVFDPTHSSWSYTGTWTNVPLAWHPNVTAKQTTVAGSFADWTIPADFPGGHVNVRLVGERQGVQNGATVVTIQAPAVTAGGASQSFTTTTHDQCTIPVLNTPVCQRIEVAKTGTPQTLRIIATTLASGGRLAIACTEIEDPNPPFIVGFTIAKPKSWDIYNAAGTPLGTARTGTVPPLGAQTRDAYLEAVNLATAQIFQSFGADEPGASSSIFARPSAPLMLLDGNATMDGTLFPERYLDETHPNEWGDEQIAAAALGAFSLLSAAFPNNSTTRSDVDALGKWGAMV